MSPSRCASVQVSISAEASPNIGGEHRLAGRVAVPLGASCVI
jgi:hypothetical protein